MVYDHVEYRRRFGAQAVFVVAEVARTIKYLLHQIQRMFGTSMTTRARPERLPRKHISATLPCRSTPRPTQPDTKIPKRQLLQEGHIVLALTIVCSPCSQDPSSSRQGSRLDVKCSVSIVSRSIFMSRRKTKLRPSVAASPRTSLHVEHNISISCRLTTAVAQKVLSPWH